MPDREILYQNCNQRFLKMIEDGAIEEVKKFLDLNYSQTLPIQKAIGVKEFSSYLKNEITLDKAIEQAQQATRRYAKRQMTWFRNQL